MKALIAGAGIGGLATAIALRLRGWDVSVLEQAPALTEIGAGLQISPNGWRVLEALGVAERLTSTLFEPEAIEMRLGVSGRRVFRLPMQGYAVNRWGARYVHVHRADLVAALAGRLEALQSDAVVTGCTVLGYAQSSDSARVTFADGSERAADIVIGADGLHSVIRAQMLGADRPRYTGNVAWRAVVPVAQLGDTAPPPTACVWVGHNRHAVTTRLRAGTLANFVGMVQVPEPAPESWRAVGAKEDVRAAFDGWDPVIGTLIAQAETLNCWALFDRAPLPRWHEGRVALMGDAAHPMLPSMAQGAVQALEDAWVLAAALEKFSAPDAAFGAVYAKRIARTARVQKGSLSNSNLFHRATPLGRWGFYGPMAVAARLRPEALHARQDWVYSYDATQVF